MSSRSCFLFRHQTKYFKYSVTNEETDAFKRISTIHITLRDIQQRALLMYSFLQEMLTSSYPLRFYQYEALHGPLSRAEAKHHLILVLHVEGVQRAHLDVWLENICYTHPPPNLQVKLIDLDRCEESNYPVNMIRYEYSDMYHPPACGWKNYQLDWRCVGLLICFVLTPEVTEQNYHEMIINDLTTIPSDYPFVGKLISDGEWSDNHWDTFKTSYQQRLSQSLTWPWTFV